MDPTLVKIYFDGGSRGNPGPAAGAAFMDFDGGKSKSCFLPSATNNEAEYRGLILGIELARECGLDRVLFLGDSRLVVMQIRGEWQVKSATLAVLHAEAKAALKGVPRWTIDWIPREKNSIADGLANAAMDSYAGLEPILPEAALKVPASKPEPPAPTAGEAGPRADIQAVNALGAKASFKDLTRLKVGGLDGHSRASMLELQQRFPDFERLQLMLDQRLDQTPALQGTAAKDREKLLINVLRWMARGLLPELSVKKAVFDLELQQNFRKGKS